MWREEGREGGREGGGGRERKRRRERMITDLEIWFILLSAQGSCKYKQRYKVLTYLCLPNIWLQFQVLQYTTTPSPSIQLTTHIVLRM